MAPKPVASASSQTLLEMQISGSHTQTYWIKKAGWSPTICFNSLPCDADAQLSLRTTDKKECLTYKHPSVK